MTETRLVCGKCGKTEEFGKAISDGWLHAQRKGKPEGYLIIRCPEHISKHAMRLAGLPQLVTSKRVIDNLERGLNCEYGDGNRARAYEDSGGGTTHYLITYHEADMPPHDAKVFETVPALIQAMRKVEKDLRKWKLQV